MLTYADVSYTGVDAGCRCNRSRAWERDGDYDAHALLQDARCFVDCTGTQFTCFASTKCNHFTCFTRTKGTQFPCFSGTKCTHFFLVQKVLSLLALLVQKYIH
jgi:hypothetical protein